MSHNEVARITEALAALEASPARPDVARLILAELVDDYALIIPSGIEVNCCTAACGYCGGCYR